MDKFSLNENAFIPLCDLLKKCGFCENGGHAKAMINAGKVRVNDRVELRKRYKVLVGEIVWFAEQSVQVTL